MLNKRSKPTSWDDYPGRRVAVISKAAFFSFVIAAYNRLLRSMANSEAISLLELGCGSGYISSWLCEKLKVRHATLVDFNPQMLDVARRSCAELRCKLDFVQEDFNQLDLRTQYSIVHSQGVIEHFDDNSRAKLLRIHYQAIPGRYPLYLPQHLLLPTGLGGDAERPLPGHWPYTDEVPMKPQQLRHELERGRI